MSRLTLAHRAGINDAIALYRRGSRKKRIGRVEDSARFYTGETGVLIWTKDEELAKEIAQCVQERAQENKVRVWPERNEHWWWVIFTPLP